MDLLRGAYSTASDDDDDNENGASNRQSLGHSSLKRHKPDNSFSFTQPERRAAAYPSTRHYSSMPRLNQPSDSQFPRQAPAPGRYVSKRERALLGSATRIPDANSNTPATTASPGLSLSLSL